MSGKYGAIPSSDAEGQSVLEAQVGYISSNHQHRREVLAEFLGTLILVLFGVGVNNVTALAHGEKGGWLSVNIGWGLALMLGVYASGGVSGGHLNPAVTIANAFFGKFPWTKVPGYVIAQTFASFVAAFMIYVLYYPQLGGVDGSLTRGNFATYPADEVPLLIAFYTEFLGTAMLVLGIWAIIDGRNKAAESGFAPFAIGMLLSAIGISLGMNTGYALNPARDFGPRLFTFFAGYGFEVFTARAMYFWVPIVGPIAGGIAGAGLYKVLIEDQHPSN